jgi:predicted solute-binding protein
MARERIGTVGYLNARPLTSEIDLERYELVADYPAAIARELAEGRVEMGLIPVAAVLSDADYRVLGGMCIGADGAVDSVLLVAETPIEDWERVVLDGESRTSAVLAQLLLRGPLGRAEIEVVAGPPGCGVGSAVGTTAALVIGDAARDLPDRLTTRVDLAAQWTRWTGLPFVFAVWAGRPGVSEQLRTHLVEAGRSGLAARGEQYDGDELDYLTRAIRYELDDRALIGLRRFAAMGHAAGLLGSPDVSLYGPILSASVDPVDHLLELDRELTEAEGRRVLASAGTADLLLAVGARTTDPVVTYRLELRITAATSLAFADELDGMSAELPDLRIEGASVDEVCRIAHQLAHLDAPIVAMDLDRVDADGVSRLHEAGVTWLVGTGWAPLDPRVRQLVDPDAQGLDDWLYAVARARSLGMLPTGTCAIGRGELARHRVAHVARLAELGLPVRVRTWSVGGGAGDVPGNTATDYVRVTALAGLLGSAGVTASWSTQGPGPVQAVLHAGCRAIGSVTVESMADLAGVAAQVEHHIRDAGLVPRRQSGVATVSSAASTWTAPRP